MKPSCFQFTNGQIPEYFASCLLFHICHLLVRAAARNRQTEALPSVVYFRVNRNTLDIALVIFFNGHSLSYNSFFLARALVVMLKVS